MSDTRPNRLTDADKQVIRHEYANGVSQSRIAAQFGVSQATVNFHCHGVKRIERVTPIPPPVIEPGPRPLVHRDRFMPGCAPRYGR